MFKRITAFAISIVFLITNMPNVYASSGESGYFGGISQGVMLPKTISQQVQTKTSTSSKLLYKEWVFITGQPIEVKGNITITKDESTIQKNPLGSYKEKYVITAVSDDGLTKLNRTVELETSYIKYDGNYSYQVKKDSTVTKWRETIDVDGKKYEVNYDLSDFGNGKNITSFIEDQTPGITYYNGNISYRVIYKADENEMIEVLVEGESYGFQEPWSKVENQKFIYNINATGAKQWQMAVEVKPFLNSKKTLMYQKSNPLTISFAGTYTQKFDTEGGMNYRILTNNQDIPELKKEGAAYLSTPNDFEKLRIPGKLEYVGEGYFAKDDILKLISMEIIEENGLDYQPYQAISRGEYIKQLCKAVGIKPYTEKVKSGQSPTIIFADVPPEHDLYAYINGAYNSKLVKGVGNSMLKPEEPLTREEAFVLLVRVLGLERLGIQGAQVTPFRDDNAIAPWAKESIYAGYKIGLLKGDPEGYIHPKSLVSKGEAAAIVNRMIEFLRQDMINYYEKL